MKKIWMASWATICVVLAVDSALAQTAPVLYGVDAVTAELLVISTDTAAVEVVGTVGAGGMQALTWDPGDGLFYGFYSDTGFLVSIDPATGTVDVIGATGLPSIRCAANNPIDDFIYIVDGANFLCRINKATAGFLVVGPAGHFGINALDFEPTAGTLYGAQSTTTPGTGFLVTFGTWGAISIPGSFVASSQRLSGIAIAPDGTLYGIDDDLTGTSKLYEVNPLTGVATLIGDTGRDFIATLTFAPPPPTDPTFIRGDANADGAFDIADPIAILDTLFGSVTPPCDNALDANDDEAVDIADAIWDLTALFSMGALPPAPHPGCDVDPTPGSLSCDSFPACP